MTNDDKQDFHVSDEKTMAATSVHGIVPWQSAMLPTSMALQSDKMAIVSLH